LHIPLCQIRGVLRIDNVLDGNGVRFIERCKKAKLLQAVRGFRLLIAFDHMQKYELPESQLMQNRFLQQPVQAEETPKLLV
jgi:hypothetical protein